ncbi:hypothetical protein B0H13DRAFT_1923794 [Mycena leptocephala]|nr:hypothetical protein B0H13DRAFT_1923794 [Mycena leptocephala]
MSTFDASLLTSAEEASVRALHKSVRATQYEDPVDQDTFLIASARSVLELQPQVASFVLTPDIGECVFAIRSKMLQNNSRLHTPPDATFALITDFAGEIVRKRQLFRERKRAQDARLSGAKAAANRAERRCALRRASGEPSASSDSDAVSIPSDDEDASARRQPTPIVTDTKTLPTPAPSPIHASLSPLTAIETLLIALALSSPIQPSLISPNPSLPDHVPLCPPSVVRLRKDPHPTEGKMTDQPRGRVTTRTPVRLFLCVAWPSNPPGNHLTPNPRITNSSVVQPAPVRTEFQIRRRLESIQAEIHRLSCTQKQLSWELQSCQEASQPQARTSSLGGLSAAISAPRRPIFTPPAPSAS